MSPETKALLERASVALEPFKAIAAVAALTIPDHYRVDVTYTHEDGIKYGITPMSMGSVRKLVSLKADIDAALGEGEQAPDPKESPEFAVGEFVYDRIGLLMNAKVGTPEAEELAYLSHLVIDVEEYDAALGHSELPWPTSAPTTDNGALHVVQAAMMIGGVLCTLPRPPRHSDLMRWCPSPARPEDQGFLLSDGTFATRERAWAVAKAAGQAILRRPEVQCGAGLFSEDLW